MIGFLKRDFFILRKQFRSYLFMLVIYAALYAVVPFNTFLLSGMVTLVTFLTPLSALAYDQAVPWRLYAAAMPVGREKMVAARYGITLLVDLSSILLCLLLSVLMIFVGMLKASLTEAVSSTLACGLVALFMIAFILPLGYAFGPEQARVVFSVFFGVVFVGSITLLSLGKSFGFRFAALPALPPVLLAAAVLLLTVLILLASYLLSVSIVRRKQF